MPEPICIACGQPKGISAAGGRRPFGRVNGGLAHADRLTSPQKDISCVMYWNNIALRKSAREQAREHGAEALANLEKHRQQKERETAEDEARANVKHAGHAGPRTIAAAEVAKTEARMKRVAAREDKARRTKGRAATSG